jgi:hypothetical protein
LIGDPRACRGNRADYSAAAFFQLAINSHLHPPYGKQIEPSVGLAGDKPVADPALPFPGACGDRGHGEFDTLVDDGGESEGLSTAFPALMREAPPTGAGLALRR